MTKPIFMNLPLRRKTAILVLILVLLTGLPVPAEEGPYNRENAVVRAVRKVSPAVVNISTEYPVRDRGRPFGGMDPMFEWFFRDFFEPGPERRYRRNSLGSGVIIDGKRGFILTNAHVVAQTGTITVSLKDEREFEAVVIGADPDSDLAVLQIKTDAPLPAVEMGESDDLMIGEDVIAIGNPFGFSNTVTTGVVSALNRSIRARDTVYHDFIQTDASINPGNSGGPLLNINGELIGINTAIYARAQGIGFAIPITKAKRIISDLIEHGEVSQSWIGITVQDIDRRLARYMKLDRLDGVLIQRVEADSPANRAGIREGDILLSLGGFDTRTTGDFFSAAKGFVPGDRVTLSLWRNGETVRKTLRAEAFPSEKAPEIGYSLMGVRVKDATGGRSGVVITEVRPDSYLAGIGVEAGDVIRQIGEIAVADRTDFDKAVIKYRNRRSVVILLQRGQQAYYITVRLG